VIHSSFHGLFKEPLRCQLCGLIQGSWAYWDACLNTKTLISILSHWSRFWNTDLDSEMLISIPRCWSRYSDLDLDSGIPISILRYLNRFWDTDLDSETLISIMRYWSQHWDIDLKTEMWVSIMRCWSRYWDAEIHIFFRYQANRAGTISFGTPENSKPLKLLRSHSQLGRFVPGICLNWQIWLNVPRSFRVFVVFKCQAIRDVLSHACTSPHKTAGIQFQPELDPFLDIF
jgi:hypothetical protein